MDDEIQRGRDVISHGAHRQRETGHEHHGLDTRERVSRRVGVDGGKRPVVARVHGLKHVEHFGTANLTNHDPIRSHAERVSDEISLADGSLSLDVGWARLEPDDVILL